MNLTLALATLATAAPVLCWAAQPQPAAQPATDAVKAKEAATVEPAARKLLDKSSEAVGKIRDVTMKIDQRAMMAARERAIVSITKNADAENGLPFDRYKISKVNSQWKPTEEWSYDGKTLHKLVHKDKKLFTIARTPDDMPPFEIFGAIPQWLFEDMNEMMGQALVSAKVGGEADVEGVKCVQVDEVREMELPGMDDEEEVEEGEDAPKKPEGEKKEEPVKKMVITHVKHLGAEDMLPRRIKTTMKIEGMPKMDFGSMEISGTFSELKINQGLKDKDFTLALPEGYEKVEGTLADFGLDESDEGGGGLSFAVGELAPDFTLTDADGKEYTMAGLTGRVVLLDFWATWCGPCVAAMPKVQALHEKFASKPVSIFGVNTWERKENAGTDFMKKKEYTYTNLLKGDDLAKTYGVSGIPTMILIGGDRKILHTAVGFGPGEEKKLTELIEAELKRMGK
ncbi:MAG: TlpA family protein disulfide reductase [Phycisphaeraceae bacterium]|nr:MAG: TlpA family protein disulfide reductase [Phycisphaeraceae bacterium]